MPTPSKRPAKPPVTRQKPLPERLRATLHEVTQELITLAKQAKQRFDNLDDTTKRKVIAGLSGAATLLALRARHRRRKRRKG